jgi:hypothetical protein
MTFPTRSRSSGDLQAAASGRLRPPNPADTGQKVPSQVRGVEPHRLGHMNGQCRAGRGLTWSNP